MPRPVMMHDFAVTERHVVFLDLPVVYDLGPSASGRSPRSGSPRSGRASGSCLGMRAPPHGGSTSNPATCSTPSTPTTRATRSCSTWCATSRCSPTISTAGATEPERSTAGRSTCGPVESGSNGSTTARRSSRAWTRESWAAVIATRTRRRRDLKRLQRAVRHLAAARPAVRHDHRREARTRQAGRRRHLRPGRRRRRPKTRDGCSPSSTTRPRTEAIS